jgi:hypothetical protein
MANYRLVRRIYKDRRTGKSYYTTHRAGEKYQLKQGQQTDRFGHKYYEQEYKPSVAGQLARGVAPSAIGAGLAGLTGNTASVGAGMGAQAGITAASNVATNYLDTYHPDSKLAAVGAGAASTSASLGQKAYQQEMLRTGSQAKAMQASMLARVQGAAQGAINAVPGGDIVGDSLGLAMGGFKSGGLAGGLRGLAQGILTHKNLATSLPKLLQRSTADQYAGGQHGKINNLTNIEDENDADQQAEEEQKKNNDARQVGNTADDIAETQGQAEEKDEENANETQDEEQDKHGNIVEPEDRAGEEEEGEAAAPEGAREEGAAAEPEGAREEGAAAGERERVVDAPGDDAGGDLRNLAGLDRGGVVAGGAGIAAGMAPGAAHVGAAPAAATGAEAARPGQNIPSALGADQPQLQRIAPAPAPAAAAPAAAAAAPVVAAAPPAPAAPPPPAMPQAPAPAQMPVAPPLLVNTPPTTQANVPPVPTSLMSTTLPTTQANIPPQPTAVMAATAPTTQANVPPQAAAMLRNTAATTQANVPPTPTSNVTKKLSKTFKTGGTQTPRPTEQIKKTGATLQTTMEDFKTERAAIIKKLQEQAAAQRKTMADEESERLKQLAAAKSKRPKLSFSGLATQADTHPSEEMMAVPTAENPFARYRKEELSYQNPDLDLSLLTPAELDEVAREQEMRHNLALSASSRNSADWQVEQEAARRGINLIRNPELREQVEMSMPTKWYLEHPENKEKFSSFFGKKVAIDNPLRAVEAESVPQQTNYLRPDLEGKAFGTVKRTTGEKSLYINTPNGFLRVPEKKPTGSRIESEAGYKRTLQRMQELRKSGDLAGEREIYESLPHHDRGIFVSRNQEKTRNFRMLKDLRRQMIDLFTESRVSPQALSDTLQRMYEHHSQLPEDYEENGETARDIVRHAEEMHHRGTFGSRHMWSRPYPYKFYQQS